MFPFEDFLKNGSNKYGSYTVVGSGAKGFKKQREREFRQYVF